MRKVILKQNDLYLCGCLLNWYCDAMPDLLFTKYKSLVMNW